MVPRGDGGFRKPADLVSRCPSQHCYHTHGCRQSLNHLAQGPLRPREGRDWTDKRPRQPLWALPQSGCSVHRASRNAPSSAAVREENIPCPLEAATPASLPRREPRPEALGDSQVPPLPLCPSIQGPPCPPREPRKGTPHCQSVCPTDEVGPASLWEGSLGAGV